MKATLGVAIIGVLLASCSSKPAPSTISLGQAFSAINTARSFEYSISSRGLKFSGAYQRTGPSYDVLDSDNASKYGMRQLQIGNRFWNSMSGSANGPWVSMSINSSPFSPAIASSPKSYAAGTSRAAIDLAPEADPQILESELNGTQLTTFKLTGQSAIDGVQSNEYEATHIVKLDPASLATQMPGGTMDFILLAGSEQKYWAKVWIDQEGRIRKASFGFGMAGKPYALSQLAPYMSPLMFQKLASTDHKMGNNANGLKQIASESATFGNYGTAPAINPPNPSQLKSLASQLPAGVTMGGVTGTAK